MAISDIVLIALAVLFALIGVIASTKRSALSFAAFAVSFIAAFFLAKVVAEAMLGIEGVKKFVLGTDGMTLYTLIYNGFHPDALSGASHTMFYQPMMDIIGNYGFTQAFTPEQGAALYMAFSLFVSIVGIGLFLVVRLLLVIVMLIIKSFFDDEKTGVGRLFGLLIGLVHGAAMAFAVTLAMTNMAALSFIPGIRSVRDDFENSVVCKYVDTAAFGMRNGFLVDADMFDRIVLVSGLTQEESDTHEDYVMKLEEANIAKYLINFNYLSDVCRVEGSELVMSATADESKIDPKHFAQTGFDAVLTAIMEYNFRAAEKIKTEGLSGVNPSELVQVIQEAEGSIYSKWAGAGIYNDLYNYNLYIDNNKDLTGHDAIDDANNELIAKWEELRDKLNELSDAYKALKPVFGELSFTIPQPYHIPYPVEAEE